MTLPSCSFQAVSRAHNCSCTFNYFYLPLRLLLYYVWEAIKNHTQCVDGNYCLSIWRKSARQAASEITKKSSTLVRRIIIVIRLTSGDGIKKICTNTQGLGNALRFMNKFVRLSKITAHARQHLTQCQSRTVFPIHQGWKAKQKKKRKINSTDYICCEQRRTVCSNKCCASL